MADEIDLAQANDELFREMALAKHASRHKVTRTSLEHCCLCGVDIPEARRQALPGVCKCIACQTEYEFMHGR